MVACARSKLYIVSLGQYLPRLLSRAQSFSPPVPWNKILVSSFERNASIPKAEETKLSLRESLALKLHLSLCFSCEYYKKQILGLNKVLKARKEKDQSMIHPKGTLSEEAKQKMKEAIRENLEK